MATGALLPDTTKVITMQVRELAQDSSAQACCRLWRQGLASWQLCVHAKLMPSCADAQFQTHVCCSEVVLSPARRAKFITGSVAQLLAKPCGGAAWLLGLRSVPYPEASAALCQLMGVGPKVPTRCIRSQKRMRCPSQHRSRSCWLFLGDQVLLATRCHHLFAGRLWRWMRHRSFRNAASAGTSKPVDAMPMQVAACVCLFALDKADAIPVDTHVWQLACRYYAPHLRAKTLTPAVGRSASTTWNISVRLIECPYQLVCPLRRAAPALQDAHPGRQKNK